MSDEVELYTNNLCTTEYAFERFQANTIYNDEEYITLEDLVSSENKKVDNLSKTSIDSSKIMPNVPNDSSVTAATKENKCTKFINSEDIIEEHSCTTLNSEANISDTSKSDSNCVNSKPTRKRGRPITKKRGRPRKTPNARNKQSISRNNHDMVQSSIIESVGSVQSPSKKGGSKGKLEAIEEIQTKNDSAQVVSSTMNDSNFIRDKKKVRQYRGKKKIDTPNPKQTRNAVNDHNTSKSKHKLSKNYKKAASPSVIKSISIESSTGQPENSELTNVNEKILSDTTLQNDAVDSSLILDQDNCLDETEVTENNISIEEGDEFDTSSCNIQEDTLLKIKPTKPSSNDLKNDINTVLNKPTENELSSEQKNQENNKLNTVDLYSLKRPVRRRTKQVFKYDDESDEDPYANVELSDDEPHGRKKGKYNSDDEYVPGKRCCSPESSLDSDNGLLELLGEKIQRKKKTKSLTKGKNKKSDMLNSTKTNVELDVVDDDIESSVKGTVLYKEKGTPKDITEFLAKKIQGTDIKIVKSKSSHTTKLEIPVLDLNEAKKSIEIGTQTNAIVSTSSTTQTDSHQDLAMTKKVKLSSGQAEKACDFLKSIVETTAELGELMTQKSQDFIAKKINTNNVTDTYKMDYCVKKSFLLFRLAKHNLMQMEQDLESKYEEFLEANNLLKYRESKKVLSPHQKFCKDDSDCEIVEEVKPAKPTFNPKTVFLNKELSIKIAKTSKPTLTKTVQKNIVKGRHTVWINDSVMLKKVQPNQSFLAQDSRNKKPPDYVTHEMLKSFFDDYYKNQKLLLYCRPFTSIEWFSVKRDYICSYFIKDATNFETGINNNLIGLSETNINTSPVINKATTTSKFNPKRLLTICTEAIQKHLHVIKQNGTLVKNSNNEEELQKLQQNDYMCSYFIKDATNFETGINNNLIGLSETNINTSPVINKATTTGIFNPKPLLTICTEAIQKQLHAIKQISILAKNSNYEVDLKKLQENNLICKIGDIDDCSAVLPTKKSKISKRETFIPSLKCLCILKINMLSSNSMIQLPNEESLNIYVAATGKDKTLPNIELYKVGNLSKLCFTIIEKYFLPIPTLVSKDQTVPIHTKVNKVQNLTKICFKVLKKYFLQTTTSYAANSLQNIATEAVNLFLTKSHHLDNSRNDEEFNCSMPMIINCVSTVTEEDFINEQPEIEASYSDDNDDYIEHDTHFEDESNSLDENCTENIEESNWVTKVQMHELRSCNLPFVGTPNTSNLEKDSKDARSNQCSIAQIKTEPEEPLVKSEPFDMDEVLQGTVSEVTPKQELIDGLLSETRIQLLRRKDYTYDEDLFESFACSRFTILQGEKNTRIIRPQHTPDTDTFDDTDDLLVPRSVEHAKDLLMENSSDEDSNAKKYGKKKTKSTKNKKICKEILPKEKPNETVNQIVKFARRMREPVGQEEKEPSLSEIYSAPLLSRRAKPQVMEKNKISVKPVQENITKSPEKEIQCHDVDSTELISPDINQSDSIHNTRSSRLKRRRISSSQEDQQNNLEEQSCSSMYYRDLPTELLECEPDITTQEIEPRNNKAAANVNEELNILDKDDTKLNKSKHHKSDNYVEKDGWKCYSVDNNDSKLYDNVSIVVEKLPINKSVDECEDDYEVNRLTNLNTLHRSSRKDKVRPKAKERNAANKNAKSTTEGTGNNDSIDDDGDDDDLCAEFTPSEDEGDNPDNMHVNPVSRRNADNSTAKDLLMDEDDNESESELTDKSEGDSKIKNEPAPDDSPAVKTKPGPKSKTRTSAKSTATQHLAGPDIMLTADIMMTPELARLNAPALVKEEILPDKEEVTPTTRYGKKTKSSARLSSKKSKVCEEVKQEDDSSSEEEKQWVNTKEKLLKRMEKKNETVVDDEAKGAKRVSEFIEKRADAPETKPRCARGKRRSLKKMLEKRKQMKVLAKELLGEQLSGKKCAQNYGKGRRNIRKVLDKQSLKLATVMANKEEFERKRRLSHRQAQLREHLGCEEGVNVIVINDELCLEYDFERNKPVVGVHTFFTSVMKAHQYEGVKFMWDACFESVARVGSGDPGGGCILAHCMGLGKTLQVLALLHTVLTHPKLNMRRVLVVCPLSTVLNWVDEIHKWIGPVTDKIKVFELSKLKKTYERAYQLEDWYKGGGIFIIGYELFRCLTTLDPEIDEVRPTIVKKIRTALLDPGPDIVVCDEGHLLKNDCSVLAVAMSRVTTKRRIVLTGTPMQNNLREYYCMVNFVKTSLLGTYSEYSNRFENPIMNGQHRDSRHEDIILMKTRTHILHKVLEGCLQRQEASVLYPYLPKKYEYTVFIPLTQCQKDLYKHYLCHYASKGKQSVLKDFHILQKIWTHPQVLHNFQTRSREEQNKRVKAEKIEDDLAQEDIAAAEDVKPVATAEAWWLQYLRGGDMLDLLDSSNKFHVVFRLLDECVALGDKVLIFSTSLFTMDALEYFLRARNAWRLGSEYYRLDGSVPADVRQKWCREFNADTNAHTKLFLISTRAGCLGLNMTAANRVIILDTSWNPAHDIQSIFRVYRFGQKKDCFVYRLVAMGTMEQKIYERSVTKQAVACRVVDEQQIDRHYNSTELTELYSWAEDGWGVCAGVAAGVRDAALLRVAGGGALHAVRDHDSLLRGSEPALPESERAAAWHQFQLEHAHSQPPPPPTVIRQPTIEIEVPPLHPRVHDIPTTSKVKKEKNGQASKAKTNKNRGDPSTSRSDATPADKEDSLVKKIMKILIDNKFHETIRAEELTTLTCNVKRLVASNMRDSRSINDPIAIGIANLLLHDDVSLVTAASGHPENQAVPDQEQASTSSRKSRAARADVTNYIDCTDDRDPSDAEWIGDTDYEVKKLNNKKKKSKLNKKQRQHSAESATQNKEAANKTDSILISDDEDVPADAGTAAPLEQLDVKARESHKNIEEKSEENQTADEPVPLHPVILGNENFIKLVAHMYLRGNSKLSEDAAMMAAQYSTSKARSEYEATGQPVTSGLLYEIAVESLGIEQLKKMHRMIVTDSEVVPPQPAAAGGLQSLSTERPDTDDDVEMVVSNEPPKSKPGPKSKTKGIPRPKSKTKATPGPKSRKEINTSYKESSPEVEIVPAVEIPQEPQPLNVYPVGMFKGPNKAASEPPTIDVEECILPDDDDDDVIMTPMNRHNAQVPPPEPAVVPQVGSAQSTILRSVLSKNVPTPINKQGPVVPRQAQRKITQGILTSDAPKPTNGQPAPPTAPPPPVPVPLDTGDVIILTDNSIRPESDPICLSDSDDETPPLRHPVAIHTSTPAPITPAPPIPTSSSLVVAPCKPPNVLPSASFKGGTPFILTPSLKKILDPSKKYYCIKSSSLLKPTGPGTAVPDDVLTLNIYKAGDAPAQNRVIAPSDGSCNVPGTPSQPENTQIIVNPRTQSPSPHTAAASEPSTSRSPIFNPEIEYQPCRKQKDGLNNKFKIILSSRPPPNRAVLNEALGANKQHSPKPTQVDKAPPPSSDPLALFKNVIHIPADCYGPDKPQTQSKKVVVASSSQNPKSSQQCTVTKSPNLNASKAMTIIEPGKVVIDRAKPGASTKSPSPALSTMSLKEKRKTKLLHLKLLEKEKFSLLRATNSKSSTSQSSAKNKPTSLPFIDLTDVVPEKPKEYRMEKRPSPWIDKKEVKKQKRYPTLEDFNLDDIDDITELE